MSQYERKNEDRKDVKKAAQATKSRRVQKTANEVADWGSVNPETLVDAIQAVTKVGGALRFSYTRDGGAYCIGILGDGDPYNEYVKPSEDIEDYLRRLADNWRD